MTNDIVHHYKTCTGLGNLHRVREFAQGTNCFLNVRLSWLHSPSTAFVLTPVARFVHSRLWFTVPWLTFSRSTVYVRSWSVHIVAPGITSHRIGSSRLSLRLLWPSGRQWTKAHIILPSVFCFLARMCNFKWYMTCQYWTILIWPMC